MARTDSRREQTRLFIPTTLSLVCMKMSKVPENHPSRIIDTSDQWSMFLIKV